MGRYKKIKVSTPDGFSDWITPIQGYRMQCCDCSLVHILEFKVLKVDTDDIDKEKWSAEELPWKEYRIAMRAKRHDIRKRNKRNKDNPSHA